MYALHDTSEPPDFNVFDEITNRIPQTISTSNIILFPCQPKNSTKIHETAPIYFPPTQYRSALINIEEAFIQELEQIKRDLALTHSDLALLINVSRQTIYNWLDRSKKPSDTNLEKINILWKTARKFKENNIQTNFRTLRRKPEGNDSFQTLLNKGKDTSETVELLIKILKEEHKQRQLLDSKAKPHSADFDPDDYGTPIRPN